MAAGRGLAVVLAAVVCLQAVSAQNAADSRRRLHSYFPDPLMGKDKVVPSIGYKPLEVPKVTPSIGYKPVDIPYLGASIDKEPLDIPYVDPKPILATLLTKPEKPYHESIFSSQEGQTRRLRSYFPDPFAYGKDKPYDKVSPSISYKPVEIPYLMPSIGYKPVEIPKLVASLTLKPVEIPYLDAKPVLATALTKPEKPYHESIFTSEQGQTRRLKSYFPDPFSWGKDNTYDKPVPSIAYKPAEIPYLVPSLGFKPVDIPYIGASVDYKPVQIPKLEGSLSFEPKDIPYLDASIGYKPLKTPFYDPKPVVATLLTKPEKPYHESIFSSDEDQNRRRRLRSYFPDPLTYNKDKAVPSISYKPVEVPKITPSLGYKPVDIPYIGANIDYKPLDIPYVDPKPVLATLLTKPEKPYHESIFTSGQTRRLQGHFPMRLAKEN